jgi:hypothetical protein
MAFNCEICVFTTHKKYNFEKHLRSQRHFINEKRPKLQTKIAEIIPVVAEIIPDVPAAIEFKCKQCEKSYRHHSSLSKHVKNSCNKNKNDITDLVRVLYNRLIKQENKLENLSREMEELKRSK